MLNIGSFEKNKPIGNLLKGCGDMAPTKMRKLPKTPAVGGI